VGTVTVAVRVPVALAAGEKDAVMVQLFNAVVHWLLSIVKSAGFVPPITTGPVTAGSIDVGWLAGVLRPEICDPLVVPGPCPGKDKVEGTKLAASMVPVFPVT